MHEQGYLNVVSIAMAERARWEELHQTRELLQQWPGIEKLADKTDKVLAAVDFDCRVRELVSRYRASSRQSR